VESARHYKEAFFKTPSAPLLCDSFIFDGEHRVEFLGLHKISTPDPGDDVRSNIRNHYAVCWRVLPDHG